MRCNNLIVSGVKNAWTWLTEPKGCPGTFYWTASSTTSMALIALLSISFYYNNLRFIKAPGWKLRYPIFSCNASRFPYEPTILLVWATIYWINGSGLTLLSAYSNPETRAKMWEGMDIFGGDGKLTIFYIVYFLMLEIIEMTVSEKVMMKTYLACKAKKAMLPIAEEEDQSIEEFMDEKREVSIYEAIATTPVPNDSQILDTEASTLITPRPSFLQRVKMHFKTKQCDVTAETVLGRHYLSSFVKSNLLMCFVILGNASICKLTPEQYFDNKAEEFMLTVVPCMIWIVRGFMTLSNGIKFARTEMSEQNSVQL